MSAKIFTWVGHPASDSLSHALIAAYEKGVESQNGQVRRLRLDQMDFKMNLSEGYNQRMELEADLLAWQKALTWCTHTCWAYPMWWGSMPAKMKGAIDRALLPGFGFSYHETDPFWDRLLKGRSGEVMITADTPDWFDRLTSASPVRKQVKKKVMEFVGIKPVRTHYFAATRYADEKKIEGWKARAFKAGARAARRTDRS